MGILNNPIKFTKKYPEPNQEPEALSIVDIFGKLTRNDLSKLMLLLNYNAVGSKEVLDFLERKVGLYRLEKYFRLRSIIKYVMNTTAGIHYIFDNLSGPDMDTLAVLLEYNSFDSKGEVQEFLESIGWEKCEPLEIEL